jgi:ATP-dependent Clp protease ATP-binding subunit ClpA
MPTLSEGLEQALQRAIAIAGTGHQEYATLEHLLLALTDDAEAAAVLRACNIDLEKLRRSLVSFIDSEFAKFETGRPENSKPSAAFQRVVQRAVTHVQSTTRREEVTAADVLVAILTEGESHGIGTCGLYPFDVASTKVSEVLDLAREQQHPLQCALA